MRASLFPDWHVCRNDISRNNNPQEKNSSSFLGDYSFLVELLNYRYQVFDKKAEWARHSKEIEDMELRQTIKNALDNTKRKHGRRTIPQEAISVVLNNIGHGYEAAYIKAALLRANHLDSSISFSTFMRAMNRFSGREYKYDPAQRVDSFITVRITF